MVLPIGNEPLLLADGTEIDCTTGKVIKNLTSKFVSIPSPSEAQQIIARTRRTVAELPLPPENLSGVALVAFYTLFGLSDQDICIAVENKLSIEQIKNVRKLEAYIDFMQTAKENILHTQQDTVRDLFAKHASNAAQTIINLSTSDVEVLAFKASQDVLDRAGHRPADIVEHRHKMEDSLNIVVIKRDETNPIPIIDVSPERINSNV